MITAFIQTKSSVSGHVSASWGHAPMKVMKFNDEPEAIKFATQLCDYLDVTIRLTFKHVADQLLITKDGIDH